MPEQPTAFTIPMLPPGSPPVTLLLPTRTISAENWEYMLRVLEAMRPGLVTRDDAEVPDAR